MLFSSATLTTSLAPTTQYRPHHKPNGRRNPPTSYAIPLATTNTLDALLFCFSAAALQLCRSALNSYPAASNADWLLATCRPGRIRDLAKTGPSRASEPANLRADALSVCSVLVSLELSLKQPLSVLASFLDPPLPLFSYPPRLPFTAMR